MLEYIRYEVDAGDRQAFQAAYQAAGVMLDADTTALAGSWQPGSREPEHFIVRTDWDSLDGHEQGFRRSPGFKDFLGAVRPFFDQIEEMNHYSIVREQSSS